MAEHDTKRAQDIVLQISRGGGGGGTMNYNALINKPKINGVELVEDKSLEELGVEEMTNADILETFKRVFEYRSKRPCLTISTKESTMKDCSSCCNF